MRKSLTREERLRGGKGIEHVFGNPERMARCRGAKLVACHNGLKVNRFAAVSTKKTGGAVKRNYTKRVFKEIYRTLKREISTGYDIVVIAYGGEYEYAEREEQFLYLIHKAAIAK